MMTYIVVGSSFNFCYDLPTRAAQTRLRLVFGGQVLQKDMTDTPAHIKTQNQGHDTMPEVYVIKKRNRKKSQKRK